MRSILLCRIKVNDLSRWINIRSTIVAVWLLFIPLFPVNALTLEDCFDVGAAFMTNLTIHELGHQIIADEVNAENHQIQFFAKNNGQFFFGLATYDSIPRESRLPYAAGGERMSAFTFEYALQSYRDEPTTYNKALMFFSTVDFLAYTLIANYVTPENDMYDPNIIRKETGCSKELLLSVALTKALLNTYRITHKNAHFMPLIETTRNSAMFVLHFSF